MSRADPSVVQAVMRLIEAGRDESGPRPYVLGLCGSQGSGKTTLASAAKESCESHGLHSAMLSIDDLYLTRAERQELGRSVHPLLTTRGPPGTHDVALGLSVLAALDAGEACRLPRFDKASDDRLPESDWPDAPAHCDVVIFEGWCIGALPQAAEDLREPVNALEADEDPDGIWRSYVNDALGGAYQTLFARIDGLALLAAPGFEVVHRWRLQQEEELVRDGADPARTMNSTGIARFIQHYERLTCHILAEMPGRADLIVRLDEARRPLVITVRQ